MKNSAKIFTLGALALTLGAAAQHVPADRLAHSKFRQLEQELPTPNSYRNAAGAPGHAYYQNRADYDIQLTLDEKTHRITGTEWITYRNNSPDAPVLSAYSTSASASAEPQSKHQFTGFRPRNRNPLSSN